MNAQNLLKNLLRPSRRPKQRWSVNSMQIEQGAPVAGSVAAEGRPDSQLMKKMWNRPGRLSSTPGAADEGLPGVTGPGR